MSILKNILSRIISIETVKRQSIITFIEQITFTCIGFLSTMYFAHTVGSSVLGAYFLFLAYYSLITMLSKGGLGGAAVKRISEGNEQDAYFSTFFILNLLFTILVTIILIIFRNYFIDLNTGGVFNWLLIAIIITVPHLVISKGVAGQGKIGIFSTCNFINNISRIVIQIICVFFGFGVAGLAGGFVAGMLIAGIIEFNYLDLRFVRFGWNHVKYLTSFSFWLFLTSIGVMLYTYTDTIMIGYFMTNADVGIYRVVFQFTTLAIIATTTLRTVLWPKVSYWGKIHKNNLIEESLTNSFVYSLLFAIPVLVGGILLGDKLLYYFYGAEFARGYNVLIILLVTQIVNVFQFFFTMYLGALDRQKDSFIVTAIAASANIILNLLLIPVIGILGAAIATLITMTLNAVLAYKILSRVISIRLEHHSLLNIIKASLVMAILVGCYRILIPLNNVWVTLIPVVLGGMIYGVLILKSNTKICNELKTIATQMNMPWPNWL